jgi:hypothetical protein
MRKYKDHALKRSRALKWTENLDEVQPIKIVATIEIMVCNYINANQVF